MRNTDLTASAKPSTPAAGVDVEVARLNRDLARGTEPVLLLSRLASLALRVFDVRVAGIRNDATDQWHLPLGSDLSMATDLDHAALSPDPHQWVVSVPLFDEQQVLGRLVLVTSTVNRTSAHPIIDARIDKIVETASLLLMATQIADSPVVVSRATVARPAVVAELRRDLAAGRFVPHYQPVVELLTEKVVAFEALVRWNHPERGWVRAADFIEDAEGADLVADIQAVVFRQAAERARGWIDGGMKRVRVNLKLSGPQLESPRLVDYLTRLMTTYRLPQSTLGLLLTESMLESSTARHSVEALSAAGFRVTLEGFGTSYSQTRILKDYPLYALKIDRAIVSRLATDPSAQQAARIVIQMARTLDVRTIAEGVETEAQREALAELRCDAALGFLWSPAVEYEVANSMMRFQPFASRRAKRISGPAR